MAKYGAGYKRQLFYGTAGSTAATLMEDATDIDVSGPNSRFETTTRGDGTSVPINTQQVDQIVRTITFKIRYISTNATTANLIAAAKTGADVALLVKRESGGETEFDGDASLTLNSPGPLTGGMDLEFEATPSRDSGRAPVFS